VGSIIKLRQRGLWLPLFFFSFDVVVFYLSLLLRIYFLVLVRKFILFYFVVLATLINANSKKNKDC
jgi:hypothetical protein